MADAPRYTGGSMSCAVFGAGASGGGGMHRCRQPARTGPASAAGGADRAVAAAEGGGERGDVGREPDRGVAAGLRAGARGRQPRASGSG